MGSDFGISGCRSSMHWTTRSLAFPSPSTRKDSVSVMLLRFVTSITLFPAYHAQIWFNDTVESGSNSISFIVLTLR